jgi:dolichol-phosphate mannosyltransferase
MVISMSLTIKDPVVPESPNDSGGPIIVLPTFNEAENLPRIVPAALEALPECRILIVDDHSPDGTGDIADKLAAEDSRVRVSHRSGPRGLGPAYLHGFGLCLEDPTCTHILEMDADFSHQPKYLPDFLAAAKDADLVLGCRYMPGGGIEGWAPHRLAISRLGNRYARTILGLQLRDLTGGFKCFRREVLETIDLSAVQSIGYGFQIELTWRAVQAGFKVAEVPIIFPDRTAGESKMSPRIMHEAMLGIIRMRFR